MDFYACLQLIEKDFALLLLEVKGKIEFDGLIRKIEEYFVISTRDNHAIFIYLFHNGLFCE